MILVDRVLGNRNDDPRLAERWDAAAHAGRLETVTLPADMARRHRLRVVTDVGTEVGISLGQDDELKNGDVLIDDESGPFVVVLLESGQSVSFRYDPSLATAAMFAAGVQLGHLLGMQHWAFNWVDDQCTVPISDRRFVESVLSAHPVTGVSYQFSSRD